MLSNFVKVQTDYVLGIELALAVKQTNKRRNYQYSPEM